MIPLDHFSDESGCKVGYFSPGGSGEKRDKRRKELNIKVALSLTLVLLWCYFDTTLVLLC